MSNPDYTDDDLAILRSGSWGAEPDVPAESGTPDEPGSAESEPETAEQVDEGKSMHETDAPIEPRPQP
ncbi:hypothetical protein, partial [Rothia nasisuis]|uniref:hypothetical protein n=2 Tax=Rothia nasisuis TaxID=2109647 RepID=UPI001F2C2CC8